MSEIEDALFNSLRVYTTALKILLQTGAYKEYPLQFDHTIDKLYACAVMANLAVRKEYLKLNVSKR